MDKAAITRIGQRACAAKQQRTKLRAIRRLDAAAASAADFALAMEATHAALRIARSCPTWPTRAAVESAR